VIYVTRLDGSELVVNAELIETVEQRPDTVISLTTGRKLVVQQSTAEIIERVIDYRRRIHDRLEIIIHSEE
jgi:flagellar protein FlbD